jgi:nucleoside-diphosphate-sugar epimerase
VTPDLVTGATGFIGRHLVRRLVLQGRAVRALCLPGTADALDPVTRGLIEIREGDVRDDGSVRGAMRGVGRVFHCAGHVSDWGREEDFVALNVTAVERVLGAAADEKVRRCVHLSSIAVFGVPAPATFDDATPHGPGLDLYSRTKIAGEKAALALHARRGLPVAVLRPPVVYGPMGTWAEEPVAMIRRGRMFLLGGGKGTCHPCYVENLVDAMLLAAEHPRAVGNAYIVGDDEPITFAEYWNHLARIVGRPPIRRSIPVPVARAVATILEARARALGTRSRPLLTHAAIDHVTAVSRMSIARIRADLGFVPRYGVASAMAEMEAWFRHGRLPAIR